MRYDLSSNFAYHFLHYLLRQPLYFTLSSPFMTILRSFFFLFIMVLFSVSLSAQSYITAAGLRVDKGINLTVQQRIMKKYTVEGILHTSLNSDDGGVTLLMERHKKILFRNLNIYTGLGGHYYWEMGDGSENGTTVNNIYGLSGIVGAELSLGRINVSVDLKPELHLNSEEGGKTFGWNGASVSVRYIIAKPERTKLKDTKLGKVFSRKKKKK